MAHHRAAGAERPGQVHQHAAALHAFFGVAADAEFTRERAARWAAGVGRGIGIGPAEHVHARGVAVVVHAARLAVALDVEHRAHVAQAVPLRGVLHGQRDLVVGQHVHGLGLHLRHLEVQVGRPLAEGGLERGRVAARIQHVAAGQVQRQRQAEHLARPHLAHRL